MNRLRIIAVTALLGSAAALGVQAVASAHGASAPPLPGPDRSVPAALEPVPSMPRDLGLSERLILVTAGTFDTRSAAEAADAALSFGEVQGFYAVPTSQFQGLAAELGSAKPWALVSAFRTRDGAEEFAALARVAGADPYVTANRMTSLGGEYAGLGQEESPDGTGSLTRSIPDSEPLAP